MFEDEPHAEGAAVVAAAGEALQALCQELNLDEGSAAEALDDFTAIRGNYSLEVSGGRWAVDPTLSRPHPRSAPTPPLGWWEFPSGKGRWLPSPAPWSAGWKGGCSSATHPSVLRQETEERPASVLPRHSRVPQTPGFQTRRLRPAKRRRCHGTAVKSIGT
jgi:hypothetical protein